MRLDKPQAIIFPAIDIARLGLAYPRSVLQHGLKHRLQIAGRRTDNLQHVRRGRLLFERLPQFVERPRVLDSNDRLRSEVLNQFDLCGVNGFASDRASVKTPIVSP